MAAIAAAEAEEKRIVKEKIMSGVVEIKHAGKYGFGAGVGLSDLDKKRNKIANQKKQSKRAMAINKKDVMCDGCKMPIVEIEVEEKDRQLDFVMGGYYCKGCYERLKKRDITRMDRDIEYYKVVCAGAGLGKLATARVLKGIIDRCEVLIDSRVLVLKKDNVI